LVVSITARAALGLRTCPHSPAPGARHRIVAKQNERGKEMQSEKPVKCPQYFLREKPRKCPQCFLREAEEVSTVLPQREAEEVSTVHP